MTELPGYRDTETCKENQERFIHRVSEFEIVWGLKGNNSWAVCNSNEASDKSVMLFWSDSPYAKRVLDNAFVDYEVTTITLFDFLFRLLPGMQGDGVLAGTNWTPDLVGLEISPTELKDKIIAEMKPDTLNRYRDLLAALLAEQKHK